jgi:hypothetical protein
MAKQRAHKAGAAVAQAAKDRQFKASQKELGLLLDEDGEELALSTPQKAAAWRPVVQSSQQCDGGTLWKHAAQVDPDPSSSVPIPTLPPHLLTLVPNLLEPAGQDARRTKLPVSPGPSCSPYIESPPAGQGAVIRLGIWRWAPCLSSQCWTLISRQCRGKLAPRNPGQLQVRTKTWVQLVAVASLRSRLSSIKCVVDSTLQYTTPNDISLQVHNPPPPSPASRPVDHQESVMSARPYVGH